MKALLLLLPLSLLIGCAVEAEPIDDTGGNIVSEPDPCGTQGEVVECTTDWGAPGAKRCQQDRARNDELFYTVCGDISACAPGDVGQCFGGDDPLNITTYCVLLDDGNWGFDPMACNTPLVLSFDDRPVEFTQASGSFDLVGAGLSVGHDWVSADTPWLAIDLNDNGLVDDGSELFGSMTRLVSGNRAEHGFAALAELDENADGRIDARDAGLQKLLLWRDQDQNRQSSPDELTRLVDDGVVSLSLDYGVERRCSETACEIERAGFDFVSGDGSVKRGTTIDVHFRLY